MLLLSTAHPLYSAPSTVYGLYEIFPPHPPPRQSISPDLFPPSTASYEPLMFVLKMKLGAFRLYRQSVSPDLFRLWNAPYKPLMSALRSLRRF